MLHVSDAMIDAVIDPADAQQVLLDAFKSLGLGQASVQGRQRIEVKGMKLSTMGAVIPDQNVAGTKIYTTLSGQFSFIIVLFSTIDGQPLATFDADAITRLRTAACSVIASRYLARSESRRLALFGMGVQGRAHALQFARAYSLERISVCSPEATLELAKKLEVECDAPIHICSAEKAVEDADIIITASRAHTPLFAGESIPLGCFVAAIGSSLPTTRELDNEALERASVVAVEWRNQSLIEAGDLVLAGPDILPAEKIVELADLVNEKVLGRRNEKDITIYKAVGIGLQDVALAGLAYRRILLRN